MKTIDQRLLDMIGRQTSLINKQADLISTNTVLISEIKDVLKALVDNYVKTKYQIEVLEETIKDLKNEA